MNRFLLFCVAVATALSLFAFNGTRAQTGGARLDSASPSTVERSGYFVLKGVGFGATQGTGRVLVDGLAAIVVKWADAEIVAYVPEGSRLGTVAVEVAAASGASNQLQLYVTERQPSGHIRWRARVFGDYINQRSAVAPPGSPDAGTVYAGTSSGQLYAWTPDGALKWVASGVAGTEGPVSVGTDGTIYAASYGYDARGRFGPSVLALNTDGTRKWEFVDADSQSVRAGPNVGPDGKIYVVFRPLVDSNGKPLGVNFAALHPTGALAWSVNRNFYRYGQVGKELVFGRSLSRVYFAFDVTPDPSPGFVNGGTFAYDFNGRLVWEQPGMCCGVPAVAPDEGVRHGRARLNPNTGQVVYSFTQANSPQGAPDAGPDNTHYIIDAGGRLYAINPSGAERWHYDETGILFQPVVSPSNNIVFVTGRTNYGEPGFFVAVDPATGQQQWKQFLPTEPGMGDYGQVVPMNRPTFSSDGATVYVSADVAGRGGTSDASDQFNYFYAVSATTMPTPPPAPATYTISGQVTANNSPLGGVQVTLGGSQTAQAQTDAAGNYTFNGLAAGGNYTITPTLSGYTFTPSQQSFAALAANQTYNFSAVSDSGSSAIAGLQFYPLAHPVRLLDTRAGQPACNTPGAPLAANAARTQAVNGTCDGLTIPATARAIVGNATAVNGSGTDGGFVTLYASGAQRPAASNLNFTAGQTVPNSFTATLGADGALQIYSSAATHFILDVAGYYAPPTQAGLYYHPLPHPVRLLDTRIGQSACDAPAAAIQGNTTRNEQARITCDGTIIPADAQAVVGNVTVVNTSPGAGSGYVTLYPGGATRPSTSNLNYTPGQVVPNSFTVSMGADGTFNIYALTSVDVIVDVAGYYSTSAATDANGVSGLLYYPLSSPARLLDTRAGQTACDTPGVAMTADAARTQVARVTCSGQTVPAAAQSIVGNATVVNSEPNAGGGYVTLYPSGATRPPVSNLNYVPGQVVSNAFTVGLGADGAFNIYALTSLHFIADLTGYFAP